MFILTPIAINSSLTSKQAHVCIPTVIAASLAISCDFSNFSFDCSDRVSKRQREGEEIEASICTVFVRFHFLSSWILSHKSQRWRCAKLNHELHIKISRQPTVNEFGIVILLRWFVGFCGKRKSYDAKCISLNSNMISKFPTVRMLGIGLRTWCLNFMTIQRWMSWNCRFSKTDSVVCGKKKGFWKKKGKKWKWGEGKASSVWKLT